MRQGDRLRGQSQGCSWTLEFVQADGTFRALTGYPVRSMLVALSQSESMDSQTIRTHNGFMQRMAASIYMAICSSSNPFVEEFLGGAAGVRHELAQLQCLRDHIAASPSVEPHPMFSEVLNKYLFAWGEAEKFLACTVGKGCEYWRERFYSSMRKQS